MVIQTVFSESQFVYFVRLHIGNTRSDILSGSTYRDKLLCSRFECIFGSFRFHLIHGVIVEGCNVEERLAGILGLWRRRDRSLIHQIND